MPDTVFYYDDGTSSSSAHTTLTLSSWNTAKGLVAMDIGDQVTTIGTNAFLNPNAAPLRRLYLPKNVTTIQNGAFLHSGNISRITITNENLTFGVGQVFIGGFWKHLVFSDGVTVIKASMMQKLKEFGFIASITVSKSVTNIENSAFALYANTILAAICFLGDAPTFGSNVFFSPSGNLKIFRSPNSNGWPSTIQGIEVISLTNTAFIYANGYGISHTLSSDTTITSATYGINNGNAGVLVHVIFGGTATSIGANAFDNYGGGPLFYLTSFTFMDTCILSSIGAFGFAALFFLTEIELPNTITSIGTYAFASIFHLQKIKLSNSLTTISDAAFWASGVYGGLSEIAFPASVTSIGQVVFAGAQYLKDIYFLGNQPTFFGGTFFSFIDIHSDAKIYRIPGKNWSSYFVRGEKNYKIIMYPVELFYPQNYIFRNRIRSGGTGKTVIKGDKDAKDYIRRVEAADGQPLEPKVILAITDFVIGCKQDGIWDAIKSSCILAGARTLAGALVPLKGGAPTNFNFISSDYNRATGLKGDGSSKFLDSGLTSNSFPGARRENQHLSVNISEFTGGVSNKETFIGYDRGFGNESGVTYRGDNNSIEYSLLSPPGSGVIGAQKNRQVSGFTGVTRNSTAYFELFFAPPYYSQPREESTPPNAPNRLICVFARGSVPSITNQYTTARINFYSIGTNINSLGEQFQARVLTLLSSLSTLT